MANNDTRSAPGIRVFLDIRGFAGDPSGVTKILGIPPDEAWAEGEVIPEAPADAAHYEGPRPRRKPYGCWTIKAALGEYSYSVEDYIKDIIDRVSPVRERLRTLAQDVNLKLCVWIDIYPEASMPAITMHLETMKFLVDIGAEVDIDLSLFHEPQKAIRPPE